MSKRTKSTARKRSRARVKSRVNSLSRSRTKSRSKSPAKIGGHLRPSPTEHAADLDRDTEMMGNDGFIYKVSLRKDGSHFWQNLGYTVGKAPSTGNHTIILQGANENNPREMVKFTVNDKFLQQLNQKPKIKIEPKRRIYYFGPKAKSYVKIGDLYIRGDYIMHNSLSQKELHDLTHSAEYRKLTKKLDDLKDYRVTKELRKLSEKILLVSASACTELANAICVHVDGNYIDALMIVDYS